MLLLVLRWDWEEDGEGCGVRGAGSWVSEVLRMGVGEGKGNEKAERRGVSGWKNGGMEDEEYLKKSMNGEEVSISTDVI